MSGLCAVRFLLIVAACTLATFAHCARPLEDEELSAVILRLLETSREVPASHLAPPHPPSSLHAGISLKVNGQPPATAKEDEVITKTMYGDKGNGESSRAPLGMDVGASGDDHDQELQRPKWMHNYFNMLHLTPSGANPIGNQGHSPHAKTTHFARKYGYPPQDHMVESRTIYDGESGKASPSVRVEANADEQPLQRSKYMFNYNSMLHKTPSGPNPIGNKYDSTSTMHSEKKYRYPPPEHRVKSNTTYDGKSRRESAKASPGVTVADKQQSQRPKNMYRYYGMMHKTPAGPNPIGNQYRATSTNDDVKKYRYPPQG